jgi:hypothetical protein
VNVDHLRAPEAASLEERILLAAFRRYTEQGIDNVTIQDVAEAAGTSLSGIYRVIGTKEDLIVKVFEYCWRRINHHLDRNAPIAGPPDEGIVERMRLLWGLRDDPAMREIAKMAFIMYRRSEHLGVEVLPDHLRPWAAGAGPSGSSMPRSREFEYFVGRLRELCQALLRTRGHSANVEFLTYSLLNYAGVTYISSCLWENAFTEEDALRGALYLLRQNGGLESKLPDPAQVG